MKKIGDYTMRGTCPGFDVLAGPKRLILDDGRFDTGYRVVRFEIATKDQTATNVNLHAKLATDELTVTAGGTWNWGDNREIAWSTDDHGSATDEETMRSIIDPDNLVIQDLFLYPDANNNTNYLIKLEKYQFTDSLGALAMVWNRSQA